MFLLKFTELFTSEFWITFLAFARSNAMNRKRMSSQERQVVLEEATVTGLLSTLNEDAQEDVLNEEKVRYFLL